jgi:TPR repeat protein
MKRTVFALIASSILASLPQVSAAKTVDLAFMPPNIEVRNICSPEREEKEDDLTIGERDGRLTDFLRIRYLTRDIRRLQARDPDRWFDFINQLITRRAEVDPEFAGIEELIARVELYIDAGRNEQLLEDGLVHRLRQREVEMTSNQRLIMAQYFLNGIGVIPDEPYARKLIVEAAYGGNPNALLSIARFELENKPVEGWDAPLELTVTMAFGGMLGRMNENVCSRAERIAKEYINGDVVSRNYDVAYAWYKFSADLGGAIGAWRVVELHLSADAERKDNKEMLRYLEMAVQRGITVDDAQLAQIKSAGNVDEEEIKRILGYNYSEDDGRRAKLSKFFELAVNIDGERTEEESTYIEYLREISKLPAAPGWIFTELADQILIRKGRWKGEAEAIELLEEAAARQDPEGMQLLAEKLMRYRDDPAIVNRVVDLLTETVERHGLESSMNKLDALYRCQVNEAPMMQQAERWARAYRASMHRTYPISATDLLLLDPFKEPEPLAIIQSQAVGGRVQSTANYAERLQVDPTAPDSALRLWAERVDRSDQTLEVFAELDFELATNPAERRLAVELFRRVYLNNGVTSALDLSIALVEHNARDNEIADEIIEMLNKSANRGEGASIRLLSRLQSNERPAIQVFQEFEEVIEDRGDFLAMMFALPFVSEAKIDDYVDRAVSLMVCGTKDVDEIGDAYAIRNIREGSYHWRYIGLHFDHGHTLSKLRLSDPQMDMWRVGAAPTEREVFERLLAEGDATAHRRLYLLTANPDLETYDPEAAATHLMALMSSRNTADVNWVLSSYRTADPDLKAAIQARFDIGGLYVNAIDQGSIEAKYEYGMVLRENARSPSDLANSARWLNEAAENGHVAAMTELGYAMAYGIGVPRDPQRATEWLTQASNAGNDRAQALLSLVQFGVGQ